MDQILRRSPVLFRAKPKKILQKNRFQVVLEFENEDGNNHVMDLSHICKWDVQSSDLSNHSPMGIDIPGQILGCRLENQVLISRMNRTQASIWHLSSQAPPLPDEAVFTDVTESFAALAIFGENLEKILEKITTLNLLDSQRESPFLTQGPVAHTGCQIISFCRQDRVPGILLSCSRGYGRDMTDIVLDAGREFGLRPAGMDRFNEWIRY